MKNQSTHKPAKAKPIAPQDEAALASAEEILAGSAPVPPKPTKLQQFKIATGQESVLVDDLDILQSVCAKEMTVEFVFDNKPYRMACRRLTPTEDAAIEHILNGALPPMKPGAKAGEWIPDFSNSDYVRAKTVCELQARSMALYWAVPAFAKRQAGLKKPDEIHSFIQSWFSAEVLTTLYQAVRNGGVTLAELVNFTSPNPSPQS